MNRSHSDASACLGSIAVHLLRDAFKYFFFTSFWAVDPAVLFLCVQRCYFKTRTVLQVLNERPYLHRPVVGTAEAAAAGSGEAVGAVAVGCAAAG